MASPKLEHYLRASRKRSGLSQTELAYLLGATTRNQVSRYERQRHVPPLRVALALEALFGTPVSELFPGIYGSAEKELRRRARELAHRFRAPGEKPNCRAAAQKLQWLVDRCAEHPATWQTKTKGSSQSTQEAAASDSSSSTVRTGSSIGE